MGAQSEILPVSRHNSCFSIEPIILMKFDIGVEKLSRSYVGAGISEFARSNR